MKTYRTYNTQIQGFTDVGETVKAIEKIAASSVHSLKRAVAGLEMYTTSVEHMLSALLPFYHTQNHPLLRKNHTGSRALVIVTGDRGLVGGLWHSLVSACVRRADAYGAFVVVGDWGKHYLEEEGIHITKTFDGFDDIPKQEDSANVTAYLFDTYTQGIFSKIDILHLQFVSLAEQKPVFTPFAPFSVSLQHEKPVGIPIFEPSKRALFNQLIQKYMRVFLHAIILETKLSELSARTVAMEHATAKTEQLIQELKVSFRKERRRVITQQQLGSLAAHRM